MIVTLSRKFLLQTRKKFGYGQKEFGSFINVTEGTYSRKENGMYPITIEEFCTILKKVQDDHSSFVLPKGFKLG